MSRTDYVPTQEALLLSWTATLATELSGDPAAFGVTMELVGEYQTLQGTYAAAYAAATTPATRTKPTIQTKNDAKAALIEKTRRLVQTLQNASVMTNAKRELLGIPIRDTEPTPVPVLRVAEVNGRVVDLELRREDGETKRKPVGVRSAWLYAFVGDTPPMDLNEWQFRGGTTKHNPQLIFPDSVAPGTAVWITALWVNPTDQPRPACAPVKTHVNYEGLNQAA